MLSFAAIAGVTLIQTASGAEPIPHLCLFCGDTGLLDFVLNVVLFVPFGVGLGLLRVRWWAGLLYVVGFTVAIETLQFLIPGRNSSVGDLISNTTGGLLGYVLARRWRDWTLPAPRGARALVALWGALWLAIVALTVRGLEISIPETTYWGQWEADLGQFAHFEGRLLQAQINGRPVESGRMTDSRAFREALRADRVGFRLRVIPGPPTPRLAPILSVFDEHEVEILVIGQDGRDLVFRVRRSASDALLRTPTIKVDGVFPGDVAPGALSRDTLGLYFDIQEPRFFLAVHRSGQQEALAIDEITISPQLGWSLIFPFAYALAGYRTLFTTLWLIGLLFPVGYWAARAAGDGAGSRLAHAAAVAAIVAAGLVVVPSVFGLAIAVWAEWAAAVGGAVAGWGVGRWSRSRVKAAAMALATAA